MRILLLGCRGQLGTRLAQVLPALGTLQSLDHEELDLSDLDRLRRLLADTRFDVLVNAAAYTAVDKAEEEERLATIVNGEAPALMAEAAQARGALLVHYSTDYVFDGAASRPYTEADAAHPLGVYGKSKWVGEQAILASGAAALILRTAWLYSPRGRNFFKTILRLAGERDVLRIVDDQIGSPTYADRVADATATVLRSIIDERGIDRDRCGIYHVACAGQTSWCGFTRRIVERSGLRERVHVEAITTEQYPTPARRPAYSVLCSDKLAENFGVRLPDWDTALQQCLDDLAHERQRIDAGA